MPQLYDVVNESGHKWNSLYIAAMLVIFLKSDKIVPSSQDLDMSQFSIIETYLTL